MAKVNVEDLKIVIGPESVSPTDRPGKNQLLCGPDGEYEFPVYELSFWSGRIINDEHGNVYPELTRSRATRSTPFVRIHAFNPKELDLQAYLEAMLANGLIRVDTHIGLMPDECDNDREAYFEYGAKLKDAKIIAAIAKDGCNLVVPKYKISLALKQQAGTEARSGRGTYYANAIKKATAEYESWNKVFAEALEIVNGKK